MLGRCPAETFEAWQPPLLFSQCEETQAVLLGREGLEDRRPHEGRGHKEENLSAQPTVCEGGNLVPFTLGEESPSATRSRGRLSPPGLTQLPTHSTGSNKMVV